MLLYAHNVLGPVSHNRKHGYSLWKIVIYVSLKGFIIITININIIVVIYSLCVYNGWNQIFNEIRWNLYLMSFKEYYQIFSF